MTGVRVRRRQSGVQCMSACWRWQGRRMASIPRLAIGCVCECVYVCVCVLSGRGFFPGVCVGFVFPRHRRFAIRSLSWRSGVCVCMCVCVYLCVFSPGAEYVRCMSVGFAFLPPTLCDPKTLPLRTPARTHNFMHTNTHVHAYTHTHTRTHTHAHTHTHTHKHSKNCVQCDAKDSACRSLTDMRLTLSSPPSPYLRTRASRPRRLRRYWQWKRWAQHGPLMLELYRCVSSM